MAEAHCPACRVVAELVEHRDAYAVEYSPRRSALSFAIILARWACPAHVSVAAPDLEVDG